MYQQADVTYTPAFFSKGIMTGDRARPPRYRVPLQIRRPAEGRAEGGNFDDCINEMAHWLYSDECIKGSGLRSSVQNAWNVNGLDRQVFLIVTCPRFKETNVSSNYCRMIVGCFSYPDNMPPSYCPAPLGVRLRSVTLSTEFTIRVFVTSCISRVFITQILISSPTIFIQVNNAIHYGESD